MTIFWGLMIPFIGTTLGALCVLFIKNELKPVIQKSLLGFAAGVMAVSYTHLDVYKRQVEERKQSA